MVKSAVLRAVVREMHMQKRLKDEELNPAQYSIRLRKIEAHELPDVEAHLIKSRYRYL